LQVCLHSNVAATAAAAASATIAGFQCSPAAAGTNTEATLSADYGGTGSSSSPVDAVYVALGRVLTISGRTIRDEAQVNMQQLRQLSTS
jgi:hypothetical protein